MIGRLHGIVVEKYLNGILLDVHGVGYEVYLPMTALEKLNAGDQPVSIYTHMVVREDSQELYGFGDQNERNLFRTLIKVSGIGARIALAMLSSYSAPTLINIILDDDVDSLAKTPGIGKKSAQKIIVELKDKLNSWQTPLTIASNAGQGTTPPIKTSQLAAQNDAIAALVSLGYKPHLAAKTVKSVATEELTSQQMIRKALSCLGDNS